MLRYAIERNGQYEDCDGHWGPLENAFLYTEAEWVNQQIDLCDIETKVAVQMTVLKMGKDELEHPAVLYSEGLGHALGGMELALMILDESKHPAVVRAMAHLRTGMHWARVKIAEAHALEAKETTCG